MTDPISRLRSVTEGMTPGPWMTVYGSGKKTLIRTADNATNVAVTSVHALAQAKPPEEEANAAGIVLATRLLRIVADEDVEWLAKLIVPDAWSDAGVFNGDDRYFPWEPGEQAEAQAAALRRARAVLAALSERAMGDE
jgi:hypothetical protein